MTLTLRSKYLAIFLSLWLISCTEVPKDLLRQQVISAEGTVAGAISPVSQLLAVSSLTSGIIVWDIQTGSAKYRLSHGDPTQNLVTHLAFSADGKYLLSADPVNVALWDLQDGKNLGFWAMQAGVTVRDIAVSDYGRHLLIGQSDGKIQHITLKSGRRLEFQGHSENINAVALSPNGRYALTGSSDLHSYFWDTDSAQILQSMSHPNRVTRVALDTQGRYLFSADSLQQAQLLDIRTGRVLSKLKLDRGRVFSSARFSSDGKWLLTGSPSQRASIWNVQTGQLVKDWAVSPSPYAKPPGAVVYDVALLNNGQVLTLSSSGLAEYWEFKP